MMKRIALSLLVSALLTQAQALQVIVWDRDLQTKLGYGELSGSKLSLQLIADYSGPVVVLFARDNKEKNSFSGLLPRYDGSLRSGQLNLDVPDAASSTPQSITFGKFLGGFKLTLSLQSAGQNVSLPGLKASPDPVKTDPGKTDSGTPPKAAPAPLKVVPPSP